MRNTLCIVLCICLGLGLTAPARAQLPPSHNLDPHLLTWLKSNVSPVTRLPYSFYIPEHAKDEVYQRMSASGPVNGAIERTITREGLDIYDGAVYQIVLSMTGAPEDVQQASLPFKYYWEGSVGNLWNIRSGYPIDNFVYDADKPEAVASTKQGQRGFIFRIIDADGNFSVSDPMDSKKSQWADWKPVAGENAWVVIAAMQVYHQKYYDADTDMYARNPQSVELRLAEELARAAMILQADNGGIRMAPLGTHRTLSAEEKGHFTEHNWWYNHISTENNISWYAALRMLYAVTGKAEYKQAMDGIEKYLHFVWDAPQRIFHQGAYQMDGQWIVAKENFALDVQTWAIGCLGAEAIDGWFGKGAAYAIWQTAKQRAGVFNKQGDVVGVGFTDEHDRISVEWSAGAMVALQDMAGFYNDAEPDYTRDVLRDKLNIRQEMETLHHNVSDGQAAYSYSSRRGWIPFGWNSHDPQVMSLASTGWMMFVDAGVNPFRFIGG